MLDRKIDALRLAGATITLEGFRPEHFRFIEHVDALFHHTGQALEREEPLAAASNISCLFCYDCVINTYRLARDALTFTGWSPGAVFGHTTAASVALSLARIH